MSAAKKAPKRSGILAGGNWIIDQVKMIEIKLSQGAKPGHGGMLPGAKVSAEIAEARGVPVGVDCISPAAHSAFSTPLGLVDFIQQLRDLSDGKPVGFKTCIGSAEPWFEFFRKIKERGEESAPDFIAVDGGEPRSTPGVESAFGAGTLELSWGETPQASWSEDCSPGSDSPLLR